MCGIWFVRGWILEISDVTLTVPVSRRRVLPAQRPFFEKSWYLMPILTTMLSLRHLRNLNGRKKIGHAVIYPPPQKRWTSRDLNAVPLPKTCEGSVIPLDHKPYIMYL